MAVKPPLVFRKNQINVARRLYHVPIFSDGSCSCSGIRGWYDWELLPFRFLWSSYLSRRMTTSRRVQDRSRMKRVHDLEIATEKWKIVSKVLFLTEALKKEPEMIIPVRLLSRYRTHFNLPKPHKISDFIDKSPKLFELFKDDKGVLWCGMTEIAEDLIKEEERIIERQSDKTAEYVTRMLMMSVDKRLPLDKIAHFRRDMGLPLDFRVNWVHKYPQYFRVVKSEDEIEFLELVAWNPSWAVTELEKKATGITENDSHKPGMLSLAFPLKFPADYNKVYRYRSQIDHFQIMSYLSPYADARGLKAGTREFEKRAVAIVHELLSFTLERRIVTDHLTHLRRELVLPQKLMRILLRHFGIFYVSERGKRFSVFLNEAYQGSELIEKSPLVLWKEKVLSLTGYRGRKNRLETFRNVSDIEDNSLLLSDPEEDENLHVDLEHQETMDYEDALLSDNSNMEVEEVSSVYKDF